MTYRAQVRLHGPAYKASLATEADSAVPWWLKERIEKTRRTGLTLDLGELRFLTDCFRQWYLCTEWGWR